LLLHDERGDSFDKRFPDEARGVFRALDMAGGAAGALALRIERGNPALELRTLHRQVLHAAFRPLVDPIGWNVHATKSQLAIAGLVVRCAIGGKCPPGNDQRKTQCNATNSSAVPGIVSRLRGASQSNISHGRSSGAGCAPSAAVRVVI
jgi:hypothetical protein